MRHGKTEFDTCEQIAITLSSLPDKPETTGILFLTA